MPGPSRHLRHDTNVTTWAVALCALMLLHLATPVVPPFSPTPPTPSNATYYTPVGNATNVNLTANGALSIPANMTFTGGELDISSMWTPSQPTTSRFGIDGNYGWQGAHNGTYGLGHGGQLSLAPSSTLGAITDFETLVETLPDWEGQGTHHGAWVVTPLNGTPLWDVPSNATNGQRVLSTMGYGGLQLNMSGCMASPNLPVPAFVSEWDLNVDHWLSLQDNDTAWVEWRPLGGTWATLTPEAGYTNTSSLTGTPSSVWSGQSNAWLHATFSLDALLSAPTSSIQIRWCFQTSTDPGFRYGWFLDNMTVVSAGDDPGVWFHGNRSGDYANNARGALYLLENVSGFSGPLELEFWADWDLEGGFADNLVVSLSVDNGTTWQSVSGIPGLPGNGYTSQGSFYMDESLGWRLIRYTLPTGLSSHVNASSVLFEFLVQTDYRNGFGGFASSGWEGVMIDDIVLKHRRGTAQEATIPLANFTTPPTGSVGHPSGWLPPSSSINEWNWTDDFGMNGPESTTFSFEASVRAPPGWLIEGSWPDGWDVGETRNTSGWGPGQFHSGDNGAAVNLTTKYASNIYTHLVTQEYTIPNNATARLAFRSWMCSEANWDGGGVSISTDGGQSWWWLPYTVGFHDQVSTANTNSPLFGQGIIDGSSQPNGCNTGKNRPFELKTYDLSNLSGQDLKARFSFFSDTYVEADGWYIDDAGVEIDVFETEGTWYSPSLSPDPMLGYGWLDGWYEQPDGTTLSIDVLDAQGQVIAGHSQLMLPALLAIDPLEHPTVTLRIHMSTNDTYVTPTVHSLSLGRTTYIDASHVRTDAQAMNATSVDNDGNLVVQSAFSLSLPAWTSCPHNGYRLTTYGDNLTWNVAGSLLQSSAHVAAPKTTYLNHTFGGPIRDGYSVVLQATGGETFERAKMERDCVKPTLSPHLELGLTKATVFSWPPQGMSSTFGINTQPSGVDVNGLMNAWNASARSPRLTLTNTTASVHYLAVAPTSNPSSGAGAQFNLLVDNATQGAELTFDGITHPLASPSERLALMSSVGCPSPSFLSAYSASHGLFRCTLDFEMDGSADLKLVNFIHARALNGLKVAVNASVLNDAKAASANGDVRAVIAIPLHVMTEAGGVRVGLTAQTLPLMTERVEPAVHERWLPRQTITLTTVHERFDPLDTSIDAPDIASVDLHLSRTRYFSDAFAHVRLDQLRDAPRFRQLSGAGLASFDLANASVNCEMNRCVVTWAFTSTWLLDDVDDLHVLTQATDAEGLAVGPTVYASPTPFNEVENDMEVVDFNVWDEGQRRLDEWSNPFWPYHLGQNHSIVAQGRVRIEGVANEWVKAGEAEATVTVRAVPPKNLSGGPDEWAGEAINWSMQWSGEVGLDGRFSITVRTPLMEENILSNTWLEIRPSLSRRGPAAINAYNSDDRTVVMTPTRLLYDTVSPTVDSLVVLDSGRQVLADGHVVMVGRTVPLRLQVSDAEGLDNTLAVWTWLEGLDDINNNGIMEEAEYQMSTVSVNRGVTSMELDLPLISTNNVVPNNAFTGKISVVLQGQDLAGNPLIGGGDFGEEGDLATLRVQQRADTTVDIEDLSLDRVNGQLLAGHEHRLRFSLSDANGLESLEVIQLALLGEQQPESCFIHFEPRFADITYDAPCFVEAPEVEVALRPLSSTYDLTVRFRLDWNASLALSTSFAIPSIVVFDEGQDLGLGLDTLTGLSWQPGTALSMRWRSVTDLTLPEGQFNQTTRWFHRNDIVMHDIGLYHANTTVLAEHLPDNGSFTWILDDGERESRGYFDLTTTGHMVFNLSVSENTMYNDRGHVRVFPTGYETYGLLPLSYQIVVDDIAPKLVLSPGTFDRLKSDQLSLNLTVSVVDDTDMPPDGLSMHSVMYRLGQPLASTERVDVLGVSGHLNDYTLYSGLVDFSPVGTALQRGDFLLVWFDTDDRSGRALTGYGSQGSPINVPITWIAFEPTFTDLSATPYRPMVGDNVTVYARVVNQGQIGGSMTVVLTDGEGQFLDSAAHSLNTGEWVNVVWQIEAWKAGRLGLNVQIVNHTPQVPVPLADIQPRQSDEAGSSMAILSLSFLSLFLAGMVLFIVRQQRKEREEAYHLERIRRIVTPRIPPPKPLVFLEIHQEE